MKNPLNYYKPYREKIVFWLAEMSFVITGLKYIFAIFILYRDTTGSSTERQELMTANIGGWLVALDIIFMASSFIAGLYGLYTWWKDDGKDAVNNALGNDDSDADAEEKSNENKKSENKHKKNNAKKRGTKVLPTKKEVNSILENTLKKENNAEKHKKFWSGQKMES